MKIFYENIQQNNFSLFELALEVRMQKTRKVLEVQYNSLSDNVCSVLYIANYVANNKYSLDANVSHLYHSLSYNTFSTNQVAFVEYTGCI